MLIHIYHNGPRYKTTTNKLGLIRRKMNHETTSQKHDPLNLKKNYFSSKELSLSTFLEEVFDFAS